MTKIHGVIDYRIACNKAKRLACGWYYRFSQDLRFITCKKCREKMKARREARGER